REIAASARELHSRLARFVEPLAKLGRQLGSAVGAYNEAVASFDHRVVPQLRRIEQAGASSGRSADAPPALDVDTRSPGTLAPPEDGDTASIRRSRASSELAA